VVIHQVLIHISLLLFLSKFKKRKIFIEASIYTVISSTLGIRLSSKIPWLSSTGNSRKERKILKERKIFIEASIYTVISSTLGIRLSSKIPWLSSTGLL